MISNIRFKVDTLYGFQVLLAAHLKSYLAPGAKREPFHLYDKRFKPCLLVEEEWVFDKVLKVQWFDKGKKRHPKYSGRNLLSPYGSLLLFLEHLSAACTGMPSGGLQCVKHNRIVMRCLLTPIKSKLTTKLMVSKHKYWYAGSLD
jgi:hypothetical protein